MLFSFVFAGGADVQLDLRLRDLKSLYTSQRSLLEQRDKEIIYLNATRPRPAPPRPSLESRSSWTRSS